MRTADEVQKSLVGREWRPRLNDYLGLTAIIILAGLAGVLVIDRFNSAGLHQREITALEAKLKEAEATLELAQQNAEVAIKQKTALETELKTAADRFQQLQAELNEIEGKSLPQPKGAEGSPNQVQASSDQVPQISVLQNQLKQAQEEEQKAYAKVNSVMTERDVLQNQLQQAEVRAVLARQQADFDDGQRSELEAQLKGAEEKLKQAQAIAGDPVSQLTDLKAQLKQEQEKGRNAQTNVDSLTSERNALQNQLKQAEAKTLVAQQSADFAESQRTALEAQLKDAQEKLKQVTVSTDDTVSPLNSLQAQFYSLQTASRMPSASNNVSGAASPPESQSKQNGDVSGNEEALNEFVLGYLRTVSENDTSVQRRYFADRVSFYGRGLLNSSDVEASTKEYHHEWPNRQWTPQGEATITRLKHGDGFVVHQPFRWAVSDGSRHAQGDAILYLLIRQDSKRGFRILNVHQLDR